MAQTNERGPLESVAYGDAVLESSEISVGYGFDNRGKTSVHISVEGLPAFAQPPSRTDIVQAVLARLTLESEQPVDEPGVLPLPHEEGDTDGQ